MTSNFLDSAYAEATQLPKELVEKLDKKLITSKKQLITSEGSYSLFIKEKKDINSLELFIGGMKGGCLIIFIEDILSDTMLLDSLKYDSKCNLKEDLKEGSGTKHMMNTAFSYVKKHYPNIKYCRLYDRSNKECKSKLSDGSTPSMNLGLTHLMLKKKTWYESILGAYIINEQIRKEYEDFVSKLETIPINITFAKFDFDYLKYDKQLFLKINAKYNLDLPNLFIKHKYYYTLFKELREKITNDVDSCLFFGAIIYKLMTNISNDKSRLFFSVMWMFPMTSIIDIDFTEEKYENDLVGGAIYSYTNIKYLYDTYSNNINSLELF